VVNIVTGFGPTAGAPLVSHPLVNKIAFTGSTEVGIQIMQECGKSLKKCSLELGGKSPLIIFEDYDMEQALNVAQLGIFTNQGQVCSASSRIFVQESIYEEFVRKTAERAKAKQIGSGLDPKSQMGPVVDSDQFKKVTSYIAAGKAEGAKLVTGGNRIGDVGFFVEPTVFSHVDDSCSISREEIFGPVMSIMKPFKDIDEAIKRANATPYGLAAGVLTNNIKTAHKVARELKAGTVYINSYHVLDAAFPFGGYKSSGIGRELGTGGMDGYLELKTVVVSLA